LVECGEDVVFPRLLLAADETPSVFALILRAARRGGRVERRRVFLSATRETGEHTHAVRHLATLKKGFIEY
jgi:hypothetical protein